MGRNQHRQQVVRSTETDTKLPELLTAAEVAKTLGLTRKALYTMVERAEIPRDVVLYLGPRRLRFDAVRLKDWIAEKRASSGSYPK